jgi:ubiquinone/menaquinone biosynthesis C-methylase UbiE
MAVLDVTRSPKEYWDAAAETYERDFAGTLIGQTRREAVWRELDRVFGPGQRVLELNCGTGIDAVHLAERGVRVLACDIAPRMIDLACQRVNRAKIGGSIEFRALATEDIGELGAEGPFDGALSNFSGLNCVEDVSAVARNLWRLLKPGAPVLLCIVGRFVPWEIVWFLAHGEPRKAVRRFHRRPVRHLETGALMIRYRSVKEMAHLLVPEFRLRKWKGIGICVPPSYLEHWACRFPKLTKVLAKADRWFDGVPVLRGMADCALLEFERSKTVGE